MVFSTESFLNNILRDLLYVFRYRRRRENQCFEVISIWLSYQSSKELAQKSKGRKPEVACFNNFVLDVYIFLFPEKVWRRTELSVLHSLNSKDLWNIHFPPCAGNWQGIPTII